MLQVARFPMVTVTWPRSYITSAADLQVIRSAPHDALFGLAVLQDPWKVQGEKVPRCGSKVDAGKSKNDNDDPMTGCYSFIAAIKKGYVIISGSLKLQ